MVTESSAKSYRSALADGVTGVDLFNITSGSTYYQNELMTLLKNNQLTDAQQQLKRAAGIWTLPVCKTTSVVNWCVTITKLSIGDATTQVFDIMSDI